MRGISSDNADEYRLKITSQNNGATPDPSVGITANIQPILLRTGQVEAVSVLLDVVAHPVLTLTPLCIFSLDCRSAFGCISHHYLFQILAGYGISEWFIDRIRSIYENVTASLQINSAMAAPIPIQSGIRQGCRFA